MNKMKQLYFVVFKLQSGETSYAYSLVDKEAFLTLPTDIIHTYIEVEDRLYSTEELEKMRNELV